MSETKKFPTKLVLGGLLIVAVLGAVYFFLISGNSIDTSTSIQVATSSQGANEFAANSIPETDEILRQLNELREIRINTDLFNSPTFLSLVDFSITLSPQSIGRENPFVPSTFIPSGPSISPRENPVIPERVGGAGNDATQAATGTESVSTSSEEMRSATTSVNEEATEE